MSDSLLPKGVELDARSRGRSLASFAGCEFTANGENILISRAIRAANSSFFLMLFGKLRIAWCQYAYADNDAAIIMGWVQGYPKSSASSVRPVPLLPRVRHLRSRP
jgi:hypothetical protein